MFDIGYRAQESQIWWRFEDLQKCGKKVLFGHWAALEGYHGEDVIGLDTGCVWGGHLTLIRWEDKKFFSQESLSSAND